MKVFKITGHVIDSRTQQGVKGLRVEAWDKDILISDLVGGTTTGDGGIFQIQFDESYFKELFLDRRPDLFFKIFSQGKLIKNSENSVLWNVDQEDIEMTIEVDKSPTNTNSSPITSRKKVGESELFRFVCRRPFQRVDANKIENKKARCYEPDSSPSDFHIELVEAKNTPPPGSPGPREAMLAVARQFIMEDPKFVKDLNDLWHPPQPLSVAPSAHQSALGFLEEWLFLSEKPIEYSRVHDKIKDVFGKEPAQIVDPQEFPQFQEDRWRLRDSIIALSVDSSHPHKHQDRLVRALRICRIIERMANPAPDLELEQRGGINKAMQAPVLLPLDIFPLPPGQVLEPRAVALEEQKRREEKREGLRAKREVLKAAIEELGKLGPSDFAPPPEVPAETEKPVVQPPWKPWTLNEEAIKHLSGTTKGALKEQRFDLTSGALPEVANALEKELALVGAKLFQPPEPKRVIRHGDSIFEFRGNARQVSLRKRGEAETVPSVPQSAGTIRPVGYGELNVVCQTLLRYEPGEIAHIENVLRGEYKERVHRRLRRLEEEVTVEEERKTVSEQDLQSTDRFELKREASGTIKEDSKKEAGLSLSGSYGPTVSFTANASTSSSNAKEQSKSTSVSYAREVTERSVSRIEERVREVRLRRAIEEFEETNTHGIDNKEKNGHIVGIYHWVDKIYQAQIINYGDRLLFEFTVPEPASFYLYALINNPPGEAPEKPEPPMAYPDSGLPCGSESTLCRPLRPSNIDTSNYLIWVSKYQASGAAPPPSPYIIATESFSKAGEGADSVLCDSEFDVKIEEGYEIHRAFMSCYGLAANLENVFHIWNVDVGGEHLELPSVGYWNNYFDLHFLRGLFSQPPTNTPGVSTLPISVSGQASRTFTMNVAVLCERGDEALAKWQQETYDAIMLAYNNLKAEYEEKLAAAAIQEGISISGRNPAQNREIERAELKKSAISIVTAQNFDSFDAMGIDIDGYPEIDFKEAEVEGSYIQFFEQAFEWPQMTYLYYPYFWGRKEAAWEKGPTWLDKITKIQDVDPQFEQFLKAGAARVVVPVRLGYEDAIMNFLETNGEEIWPGGEKPHLDDDLYVSIAEEIQQQQGVYVEKTGGTVNVTQDSAEVVGTETDFDEGDIDREIYIEGKRYVIADVRSFTELTLFENYHGESQERARYYIGAKLVGAPWEVRVPTSLVYLQQDATPLPDFTEESE